LATTSPLANQQVQMQMQEQTKPVQVSDESAKEAPVISEPVKKDEDMV